MFFFKCYLLKPNFIFCWKLQNLLDCRPQDDPETRRELLEATSWAKKYLIFSWSAKIYDLSEQISKEFVHFILFFRFFQHNALSSTPWYIACKSDPAELLKSWFSVNNITENSRSCQLDLGRFLGIFCLFLFKIVNQTRPHMWKRPWRPSRTWKSPQRPPQTSNHWK